MDKYFSKNNESKRYTIYIKILGFQHDLLYCLRVHRFAKIQRYERGKGKS